MFYSRKAAGTGPLGPAAEFSEPWQISCRKDRQRLSSAIKLVKPDLFGRGRARFKRRLFDIQYGWEYRLLQPLSGDGRLLRAAGSAPPSPWPSSCFLRVREEADSPLTYLLLQSQVWSQSVNLLVMQAHYNL